MSTLSKGPRPKGPRPLLGNRRSMVLMAGMGMALLADPSSAQVRVSDLVLTTGVSAEAYSGNLASVTVPVVDSTDQAHSLIGEVGLRGSVLLVDRISTRWSLGFDAGVRQFVAGGFSFRDYSPRELTGRIETSVFQSLGGWGMLGAAGAARARSVDDRPPMPLYLQAGFNHYSGSVFYQTPSLEGVRFDLSVDGERASYDTPAAFTQLGLLDRRSKGFELGAGWGEDWTIRFFGGLRRTDYPQQGSFAPEDPFRRDRTLTVGGTWSYASSFLAEIGLIGTLNRSNSRRPEYDAVSLNIDLASPLPFWQMSAHLYGTLTGKSYIQDTEFARLVPGEEADNASVFYLDLNRPIADNLAATLRFGWTRAETDIGNSYYERYGATLLFNYRPLW